MVFVLQYSTPKRMTVRWEPRKPKSIYTYKTIRSDIMLNQMMRFVKDEDGATAVEYGLLVALIAAVIVGTVGILGGQINGAFLTVSGALS